MKKISLLIFILFISLNLFAQESTDTKAQKIDELVSKYYDNGIFSGSVFVAQNGSILFEKGYGYADREQKIANTPETKFRIGSITKQFTSMLIMQLVEQGKIKLDGKLSDYLPYYRKDLGDKITIHNLLTHTSGIKNYTTGEFMQTQLGKSFTPKELILKHGSGELDFEPGTQYNYSNTGYVILGAVIEEVTGKKYETVLQENILTPLGMTNTGYEHNDVKMTNQAIGYDNAPGGIVVSKFIDMSIPFSAGSMYSTVEDLYKWDKALYTDKLISNESKEKMFTPFLKNYAYGWGIARANANGSEKIIYTHSGGINGFNANIARIITDNITIIVLSNYYDGQAQKISNDITKIIYNLPYKLPAKSITSILMTSDASKNLKNAIAEARELLKNKDAYSVNENEINNFGYQLLQSGKIDDAIEVFKFNVEMFPDSWNVYDSLGETYAAKGDKENAILNYKKSVEMNPNSTGGKDALKKLEGK